MTENCHRRGRQKRVLAACFPAAPAEAGALGVKRPLTVKVLEQGPFLVKNSLISLKWVPTNLYWILFHTQQCLKYATGCTDWKFSYRNMSAVVICKHQSVLGLCYFDFWKRKHSKKDPFFKSINVIIVQDGIWTWDLLNSITGCKGCKGSLPPIKHVLVFRYKIESNTDSFRAVAISVW